MGLRFQEVFSEIDFLDGVEQNYMQITFPQDKQDDYEAQT